VADEAQDKELQALEKAPLPDVSDIPDQFTEADIFQYAQEQQKLILENLKQDIELRKEYAQKIYWLVVGWVAAILVILFLQGFSQNGFSLANSVLLALVGTTTLNIVGLLYVITHYLFPSKDKEPISKVSES